MEHVVSAVEKPPEHCGRDTKISIVSLMLLSFNKTMVCLRNLKEGHP